jgi:hypothetical protein
MKIISVQNEVGDKLEILTTNAESISGKIHTIDLEANAWIIDTGNGEISVVKTTEIMTIGLSVTESKIQIQKSI